MLHHDHDHRSDHHDDDQVAGNTGSPADRDYVNEAVDYFKNKLRSIIRTMIMITISHHDHHDDDNFVGRQYGAGTEVPIKSLLGHRSQAPPEVEDHHYNDFNDHEDLQYYVNHDYSEHFEDHGEEMKGLPKVVRKG